MRLKLKPDRFFAKRIAIPTPGGEAIAVEFLFRHKSRSELKNLILRATEAHDESEDVDLLLEIIEKWEADKVVDDAGKPVPFNREAFAAILDDYPGATAAIIQGYLAAYRG